MLTIMHQKEVEVNKHLYNMSYVYLPVEKANKKRLS